MIKSGDARVQTRSSLKIVKHPSPPSPRLERCSLQPAPPPLRSCRQRGAGGAAGAGTSPPRVPWGAQLCTHRANPADSRLTPAAP